MKTVRISYLPNSFYDRPFRIIRYCPHDAFRHGEVLDTYKTLDEAIWKAKAIGLYRPELNTLKGMK